MSSFFGGFTIAKLGIRSSQQGLQITGNNISNINTNGYTRQRINQISLRGGTSDRYYSSTDLSIGMGSLVTSVSQIRDPYLDIRFRNESSQVGYYDEKLAGLEDIQSILDEVLKDGIHGGLEELRTQLEQLANDVGSQELQNTVRAAAESIVNILNKYSDSLKIHGEEALNGLDQNVDTVNDILTQIRDLNEQIRTSQLHGDNALELQDRRNMLIDELSEYAKIKVSYYEDEDGLECLKIELDSPNRDPNDPRPVLVDGLYANELKRIPDGNDQFGDYDISLEGLKDKFGDSPMINDLQKEMKKLNQLTSSIRKNNSSIDEMNKKLQDWTNSLNGTGFNPADFDPANITDKRNDLQKAVDDAQQAYENATTPEDKEQARKDLEAARSAQNKFETLAKQKDSIDKDLTALKDKQAALADKLKTQLKDQYGLDITVSVGADNKTSISTTFNGKTIDLLDKQNKFEVKLNKDADGNLTGAELSVGGESFKTYTPADLQDKASVVGSLGDGNELYGRLQSGLEHLNGAGEFDTPPTQNRGILYYQKSLDAFAKTFAESMNKENHNGIDNDGSYNLFETTDGGPFTAGNIKISDKWLNNEIGVRPSTKPTQDPNDKDNTNIHNIIAAINGDHKFYVTNELGQPIDKDGNPLDPINDPDFDKKARVLFTGSFEEMYTNVNTVLGTDMKTNTTQLENHASAATDRAVARANVSSVDLNEEGMNLIQYQKSFAAACRVMTTMDQMLDSLLNM